MTLWVLEDAMPGDCHPALAHLDLALFRHYLREGRSAVMVPRLPHLRAGYKTGLLPDAPPFEVERFDVVKVVAPCPWTERPAIYTWRCLRDSHGRHIGPDYEDVRRVEIWPPAPCEVPPW